jgi:hypothetical protein
MYGCEIVCADPIGNGAVVVGMVGVFGRDEAVARHRAHRREHTCVLDPAPFELLDDHPLARFCQVHRHRPPSTESRR